MNVATGARIENSSGMYSKTTLNTKTAGNLPAADFARNMTNLLLMAINNNIDTIAIKLPNTSLYMYLVITMCFFAHVFSKMKHYPLRRTPWILT